MLDPLTWCVLRLLSLVSLADEVDSLSELLLLLELLTGLYPPAAPAAATGGTGKAVALTATMMGTRVPVARPRKTVPKDPEASLRTQVAYPTLSHASR